MGPSADFLGRFQAVANSLLCRPNVQRRPCRSDCHSTGPATARPLPRKYATCPAGPGWGVPGVAGAICPALYGAVESGFVDGLLIFNAGYDSDSIPATVTTLNVNIEDAFQALRPGHGCVTLDGRPHPSQLTRNSFSTPQKIIRAVITVSHSPLPQPRSSCC